MLCSSTAVLSGADLLTPLLGVGATPVDDTEINKINKVIVNEFLKLRIVTAAVIKGYTTIVKMIKVDNINRQAV